MKNAIIIFGKPGSGKDTQADFVADTFNIPIINMGSIIRKDFESLRKVDQEIIKKGKLLSDETIEEIFKTELIKLNSETVLLDGFPRTLHQAQYLYKLGLNLILIYLDISNFEAVKRIEGRQQTESRLDDNLLSLKNRLIEYHQKTEPVLN